MKGFKYSTILLLASVTFLIMACSEQKQSAGKAAPEKAKVESLATTPADIKKEAGDLAKAAMTYAEEQKALYTQEVLDRLAQYNQKLMALDRKVAMLGDQAKAEMMEEVANFNQKKEQALEKVRELQASSGEAYEDLKEGMEKSIAEMDKAYDQAMNRFQK